MAKYLDADAVLERLKEIGITDSIQTVRRWLREGQLKGEMPEGELRKGKKKSAGYRVDPKDLEEFIQKKREENWLYPEVKRLEQENEQLKAEINQLRQQLNQPQAKQEDEGAEPDDSSSSRTTGQSAKRQTVSPMEIRIALRQMNRFFQSASDQEKAEALKLFGIPEFNPVEIDQYLRMEPVERKLHEVLLTNDTITTDGKYISPITNKEYETARDMVAATLFKIIEEKRKAHLQWVRENA
jgi:transposase